MATNIRMFEERDRATCESLMDAFQDELVAMDPHRRVIRGPGYGKEFVQRMLDDAAESEGHVLIAQDDGELVGFGAGAVRVRDDAAALSVVDDRSGEVTELYVVPHARGRGIGRALLARFESLFRGQGCDCMRIEVFAYNLRARSFYADLGFEERDIALFRPIEPGGD
jgi:ribosomal protein S18 acetylase RimI-like enzyme